MKIFLLEDNKTLNETIKLKLEMKGYKVFSYIDGQEALDNITEGFSCFVLDINVPNINGIEILKSIRGYFPNVPVIIISATIELDIIKKSYEFDCNDYLKKPFFIDELEIKIDRLCKVPKNEVIFDNNCIFNFSNTFLSINKKKKELSKKEALLLNLFLLNKNNLISYQNIQDYVWEGEYVSLDAIRTLIKRLKKKLVKPYINSRYNSGYVFGI